MKYKILFKFLYSLVYVKRILWWFGKGIIRSVYIMSSGVWKVIGKGMYKTEYFFRKNEIKKIHIWALKRNSLQFFLFLIIVFVSLPQTKLHAESNTQIPGQDAIAYSFSSQEQDFSIDEIIAEEVYIPIESSVWSEGSIVSDIRSGLDTNPASIHQKDLAAIVAGGSAISKPTIMPGVEIVIEEIVNKSSRTEIIDYKIDAGESLGLIAQKFDISLVTLLWENGLTARSVIQPGQTLRIPPVSGVVHKVKSGDTVLRIARTYSAKSDEIIEFNNLDSGGGNLQIGQQLIIPDGVKTYYTTSQSSSAGKTTQSAVSVSSIPAASGQSTSGGYVWPSAAKIITQYYNWNHHGLDIAGPWQSANYAIKAGTVEVSQCGWNSGYGCYIIINHGGGVKSLYGHHSKLLVSVGDYVKTGQTIGLMGNTGKVYGRTGIHLHLEIRINGVRVNPLGYVR